MSAFVPISIHLVPQTKKQNKKIFCSFSNYSEGISLEKKKGGFKNGKVRKGKTDGKGSKTVS